LPSEDFYTPTDIDALRMENELLAFEARYLRGQMSARVAEYERSATELKNRLEESERRLEESERRLEESDRSAAQLRERLAEAELAEQDIALLLQRLANSPFGWFFASRQNFRILEQRYLGTDG
jgi:DNA repair exonuclease SbcCD ATPase subunit